MIRYREHDLSDPDPRGVSTAAPSDCPDPPFSPPVAANVGEPARLDLWRGLVYVADQGIVSAASFLTSTLLGRGGGREELGLYYLALSLVLMARGIQDQVIAAPYIIYSPRRTGTDLAEYTGSVLSHQTLLSAIAMLGWLLLACTTQYRGDSAAWTSLDVVLAMVTPFVLIKEFCRQLAVAHLHTAGMLIIDLAASLLQCGIMALMFTRGILAAQSAYAALGFAAAAACLVWWIFARPPLRFRPHRFWTDWRHNWSFGRWALVGYLLGSTVPQIIPWLLAALHSSSVGTTGLLAANVSLIGLTNIVTLGVANLLSPRAVQTYATHGVAELRRLLVRFATGYVVVLGGFCLLVAATGNWLIVLVYGQDFAGSGSILLLLAVNALVNSLGVTAGNGLWAIERPRANFMADGCLMVGALIAAVQLIPSLGATGAAAAMLLGTTAATLVRIATLWQALRRLESTSVYPGAEAA